MSKTYRWDDKLDPRKDTAKAKHDKKIQGRSTKQFWRNVSDNLQFIGNYPELKNL